MNNSMLLHPTTCSQASVSCVDDGSMPNCYPLLLLSSCNFNRDKISNNVSINKIDFAHVGSFVRVSNPKFFDDLGQIIDIDSDNEKVLIKLIPRIDYTNLKLYNLKTQSSLNEMMESDYIIPRNYFDENFFQSEQKESKVKISWVPNGYINAIQWNGEKYIGRFLYKKFNSIEILTDLNDIKNDDIKSFISNIADFEQRNPIFVQNMNKISKKIVLNSDESESKTSVDSTCSFQNFALSGNELNASINVEKAISKHKILYKNIHKIDNIINCKNKKESQEIIPDKLLQINLGWLLTKSNDTESHYQKFVDKITANKRRRRKQQPSQVNKIQTDIRNYISISDAKLEIIEQNLDCIQDQDLISQSNQESIGNQVIQSTDATNYNIDTSTCSGLHLSQPIDDEFDEFIKNFCGRCFKNNDDNHPSNDTNSIETHSTNSIKTHDVNSIEKNEANSIEKNEANSIEMNNTKSIKTNTPISREKNDTNSIGTNNTSSNESNDIKSIEKDTSNCITINGHTYNLPPKPPKKRVKVLEQMPNDAGNINSNTSNDSKEKKQSNKKSTKSSHLKSESIRSASNVIQKKETTKKNKLDIKHDHHQDHMHSNHKCHENERCHRLPRRPYDSYNKY